MRILYGVFGEGMGHAIRSAVVIDALRARGHTVYVAAADLAAEALDPEVRLAGLRFAQRDGGIDRLRTVAKNVRAVPRLLRNVPRYLRVPPVDVVVTDFESWVYYYAKARGLPVVSVCGLHGLTRCGGPRGGGLDGWAARTLVRLKTPACDHYLVPAFPGALAPSAPRTTVIPPILRPEVARAAPRRGAHLVLYGMTPAAVAAVAATGVPYRAFDRGRHPDFLTALVTCRGVVSTAGFELPSEAIWLRKPMLLVPLARQWEQRVNGQLIQELGYGEAVPVLHDPAQVRAWLARAPGYARCLESAPAYAWRDPIDAIEQRLFRVTVRGAAAA